MITYEEFLNHKVPCAELQGFEPLSPAHPTLFPHQRDIASWMVRGGQRACFAAFGLGKTRIHLQVAKWVTEFCKEGKYLIIAPLGVRREFITEQGPELGMTDITYVRNDVDVNHCESRIVITNYERVRDGDITIDSRFIGVGLDEASVLRSYGSKTYQTFLDLFTAGKNGRKGIRFRFVFTATPSPNKHKELIHYGGFLGVMDTGEALTRFFKRNSTQANDLTLYPHMEEQFWRWLATWAVFMQKPSDLGYSDDGYDLPPLKVNWRCVSVDHKKAWEIYDNWGQSQLFLDKTSGLRDNAKVKRETMIVRVDKAKEIMLAKYLTDQYGWDTTKMMLERPEEHFILWHDLEDERRLIEKAIPGVKTAYGSQSLPDREEIILGFGRGEFEVLATKPSIAGSGTNLQKHCHRAIFLGSTYKFNDFIQAIHRIYRFQQAHEVVIDVIYTESEDPVIATLKKKWAQHEKLVEKMSALLREMKLSLKPDMHLKRTSQDDRMEVASDKGSFRVINNDNVIELRDWPENCVDEIVTSIPFGNQYEYTSKINDFGHNPSNGDFFKQMDYLVPLLLKVLKPGRIAAIHVKDRIRFGNVTGAGWPTVDAFSDETRAKFIEHGFDFGGRITIDTDVVRENNQTYRLGWTECCKDSSKMGVGMPEYVLIFRKPQTDRTKGFADVPVTKHKEEYGRGKWQVDASALWRSSGNRLPDPEILVNMSLKEIGKLWKQHCMKHGYSYAEHVQLCTELEKHGKLPASFMLFPTVSRNHDIWTDICRMRTLNSEQSRRNQEHHVCPLQLDIVERLINRFSNPGEVVLDPFNGIGTVTYQAIHQGRIGWGIELNTEYWKCSAGYCEQAETQRHAPTLFDLQDYTKETEIPVTFIEAIEPPPMAVPIAHKSPRKKAKVSKSVLPA